MNALLLPLVVRVPPARVADGDRGDADAVASDALDLAGSHVYLETADGRELVQAWYVGVKPRRDAVIVPCGRENFRDGLPAGAPLARARRFVDSGVSVLLVDVRGCYGVWARIRGSSVERCVEAAADYLQARGYDLDDGLSPVQC